MARVRFALVARVGAWEEVKEEALSELHSRRNREDSYGTN